MSWCSSDYCTSSNSDLITFYNTYHLDLKQQTFLSWKDNMKEEIRMQLPMIAHEKIWTEVVFFRDRSSVGGILILSCMEKQTNIISSGASYCTEWTLCTCDLGCSFHQVMISDVPYIKQWVMGGLNKVNGCPASNHCQLSPNHAQQLSLGDYENDVIDSLHD